MATDIAAEPDLAAEVDEAPDAERDAIDTVNARSSVPETISRPVAGERMTVAEFLTLDDHKGFELIDGVVTESDVSYATSMFQCFLLKLLIDAVIQHGGYPGESEGGVDCFRDSTGEEGFKKPDFSYYTEERLPGGPQPTGYPTQPPNFVVEVISPSDSVPAARRKIFSYLAAGVDLAWLVDPVALTCEVWSVDETPHACTADDELTVLWLPSVAIRLDEVLPERTTEAVTEPAAEPEATA